MRESILVPGVMSCVPPSTRQPPASPAAAARAAPPSRCARSRRSRRDAPRCTTSRSRWRRARSSRSSGAAARGRRRCSRRWSALGHRPAGEVRIAGARGRSDVGYVPQDDIIHRDLPLARTLRYAAQLRLPANTAPGAVDRAVDETLASLDLAERRHVRVGVALRRPAQTGEHRSGDADPARRVLPGRADVRPGPGDRARGPRGPPAVGGCRHDDRPHHAQPVRHRPVRPDRVPRSRRVPRIRRDARRGAAALRHRRPTVAYERLALEDTPEAWAQRFAAVRPSRNGHSARLASGAPPRVADPVRAKPAAPVDRPD